MPCTSQTPPRENRPCEAPPLAEPYCVTGSAHNSGPVPRTDAGPQHAASPRLPALLEALDGRRPQRTPVWFMRQAGRSLPEYRRLRARAGTPMLDACLDPLLAAEATLQPVRRHGVDAAVLFSDIVLPLRLAGVAVRIEEGVGPVLDHPVREARDVTALLDHRYGQTSAGAAAREGATGVQAVAEAVRRVVTELGSPQAPGHQETLGHRARAGLRHSRGEAAWTPLIGFGGGPFTLAAYMVEGRPSRDHLAARTLMHADPTSWNRLMTWCARLTGAFIATQVTAGACVAQLFDSWAGSLSPALYRQHVLPYSRLALETASQAVSPVTGQPPRLLHFGTGTARLLGDMRAAGAHAVGVDERTDLGEAVETLSGSDPQGRSCPVQGNLDPALLAAPWPVLARAVDTCLESGLAAPAHVVNLGHGVPPSTDPDTLTCVVARVHGAADWEETAREGWQPEQEQP
ncbi:uroporphyrinogen decarboxylase [Actinomyces lilanjuaniae]|uniref:uroporphyrinogen decarboxylase n=1 Tax=Actinomyces lilanjuaniae TaxID=2321394 RepID=A0ABN5PPD9_9ACTO|nr:uroporphyrinogen decarboxylase [Actinomyces lilanjuaniae]